MARVFKRKGRRVWDFRYVDTQGKCRQSSGWPDKKRTLEHALSVEAECRAVRKGEKEAPLDAAKRNAPIQQVVDEYMTWGMTQGGLYGRPWTTNGTQAKRANFAFWIASLGLATLSDIDLPRVEKVVRDLLPVLAAKTVDHRVMNLKSLINWAIRRGYIRHNPLAGMAALDVRPTAPHRALSDQEIRTLLDTAPPNRRLWYETALATGFRVNELRTLRARDLDVFGPSLFLAADYSKDRKNHRQPIPKEVAESLAKLAAGKDGNAKLLGIPSSGQTGASAFIVRDYKAAGIAIKTDAGRATWHSLRKCYVNALVRTGADVKTIMTLARHSSAQLSMEVYASADPARLRQGVEAAFDHVKNASAKGKERAKQVAQGSGNPVSLECEQG